MRERLQKKFKDRSSLNETRAHINMVYNQFLGSNDITGASNYLAQLKHINKEPIIQLEILMYQITIEDIRRNFDKAIVTYEEFVKMLRSNPSSIGQLNESYVIQHISAAEHYLTRNDYINAKIALDGVSKNFHTDIDYLNVSINYYTRVNDHKTALKLAKIIEENHPLDDNGIHNRANLYHKCAMLNKALKTINLLTNVYISDKRLLVLILFDLNYNKKALEILETIPENKLNADDYLYYGKIYASLGKIDLSTSYYEKAGNMPEALIALVSLNHKEGNFEETEKLLSHLKLNNQDNKSTEIH